MYLEIIAMATSRNSFENRFFNELTTDALLRCRHRTRRWGSRRWRPSRAALAYRRFGPGRCGSANY